MNNEAQIRSLVENWARAVREEDLPAIMAWHHEDIVMYDVPLPFQSIGIEAYRKTWDLFYSKQQVKDSFQIVNLTITAGEDVAFCYTPMKCGYYEADGRCVYLDFRLTIGLKKIAGQWWVMHEHHSEPAA
ncbi:MAG: nuclear transport factor 2 family protein [Chitinophagaceae bacterium]|nr:nuclear transport factor 2 family protein [Chitinophagaceae bacterium]